MRFLFGGRAFAVLVLGVLCGAQPAAAAQATVSSIVPGAAIGPQPPAAAKEAALSPTQTPDQAAIQDLRNQPMQFRMQDDGARKWVSAVGSVMRDTAASFKAFARDNAIDGATLALDSSGGSVLGAIDLGRVIRTHDMTTTVGRTIVTPPPAADDAAALRATLSPRADCESMCAFVLLAGTRREVPPEARVLVHEIWLGDRRDDATAATYSAEDIVVVQHDIGRLAQYTVEMGGGIDLLATALRIPPWEPMRGLSRAELRRMKLDTVTAADDAVAASAVPSAVSPINFSRGPEPRVRGWSLIEPAGQPVLARRHPLTVEGEEIGTFDLEIACADTPDFYTVTYRERRAAAADAPQPVSGVKIQLSRRVFDLDVVAPDQRSTRATMRTEAHTVIPAYAVQNLAAETSRSITVATHSGTLDTRIRIGNTGIAKNMAQVTAACVAQASVKRAPLPGAPAATTSASVSNKTAAAPQIKSANNN